MLHQWAGRCDDPEVRAYFKTKASGTPLHDWMKNRALEEYNAGFPEHAVHLGMLFVKGDELGINTGTTNEDGPRSAMVGVLSHRHPDPHIAASATVAP